MILSAPVSEQNYTACIGQNRHKKYGEYNLVADNDLSSNLAQTSLNIESSRQCSGEDAPTHGWPAAVVCPTGDEGSGRGGHSPRVAGAMDRSFARSPENDEL